MKSNPEEIHEELFMIIMPLHFKPCSLREIITGEKENDFKFKETLQTYVVQNTVKRTRRRFCMKIFRNRYSFLLGR